MTEHAARVAQAAVASPQRADTCVGLATRGVLVFPGAPA
jgi:hypothetical protein